jgi:membrane-associated protein
MDFIHVAVDLFLHLDRHLAEVIATYGVWTYLILFAVIFLETGIVATPFLPGDSLLFAAGTFAALGSLDLGFLILLLAAAAILGDTVNYWIGRRLGPRVFRRNVRFLNRQHLERTHAFYEKHGGKTIVIARFLPIIRTFAPFVAGIGTMSYGRFLVYNVVGGAMWVVGFVLLGYFFGNLPVVRENFSLVILAIIVLSVLPIVIEWLRHRRRAASGN